METKNQFTVYVYLLAEDVDVWRPVAAESLGNGVYRLSGSIPDGEVWQFQPGELVSCEMRQLSDGQCLTAITSVNS